MNTLYYLEDVCDKEDDTTVSAASLLHPELHPPPPLLDHLRDGEAVLVWQRPRNIRLKISETLKIKSLIIFQLNQLPEGIPPPQPSEHVVLLIILELPDVGHGVEGPPHPGGHPVGQEDIYAVVTPGQEEEDDTTGAGEEGGPVEEEES